MSTRKYASGYEKLKKRKKEEKLIESQKGLMDKFIISNKQNITQNLDENITNEQEIHQKELKNNEMIQLQDNNDVQFCNTTNLDNELQNNLEENENNDENVTNEQVHHNDVQLEENENNNDMLNYIPSNIYDPNLLVERGPIRDNDIIFPRGTRDWKNISSKIRKHETTREHITNMNTWLDLEMRLERSLEKGFIKNYCYKFDLVMQEHIRRIQNSGIHKHYLGHKIQNELIQLLANEIKCKIIKKIKEAKYFSIILDCTPDASHQEQMSLILRCVDISTSLFDEIINVINILELDINDIHGQGYDNGSNMKGKHQGVQKRLLDINPRAFYTPCGLTLKLLSQTRWESRIKNVKAIKFQAPQIRDALLQLAQTSEDPKIKSEADCLVTYEIESFEFLLGMTIWYGILFAINSVSKNLQSKDMLVDVAINQLKGLIFYFKEYRENGFTSAMNSSKKNALEMEIELVFRKKCIIHRKKQFDENVHNEITHKTISSIENRFEQFQIYEDIFDFLFNFTKLKSLDNDNFLKHDVYYDIDSLDLFSEILLTIPVTVASAERNFSKLKLIKSYLRLTMSQE
ncbi:hypothetical protein ACB092_05G066900 [Castanea dentata]